MSDARPRHVLIWPAVEERERVELAFRLIPPGEFWMGCRGEYETEEPQHRMTIAQEFWLAETPVTQAQFALWTQANRIDHQNHFPNRPQHPAENLDWRQAVRFCQWLSQEKAKELPPGFGWASLPTEAEWEYACRAGTTTDYWGGDGRDALTETGWFFGNSDLQTHAVASKPPNAWNLSDLHGNVWEWCYDVWQEQAYRGKVDGDEDAAAIHRKWDYPVGIERALSLSDDRVMRGGSWDSSAPYCRAAFRRRFGPDARYTRLGFRVCLLPTR